MRRVALFASASLPLLSVAQEQKRQPPPDFTSGSQLPAPPVPPPRAEWLAWSDVGVLLLALVLA
ncbi:MAG: hypothetical protein N2109_06160, partial [Fimbriimonadales bacterium]|nr:hypothetical protein [Fimbriimonadales bacterium]